MDQNEILTKARLKLSEDIEEGIPEKRIQVIKHIPSKNYLVIEPEQFAILKRCKNGLKMEELVPLLITQRKCPPLRELYELILKAIQFGVLEIEGEQDTKLKKSKVRASDWNFKLRFGLANYFGVLCILSGIFGMLIKGIRITEEPAFIISGYFGICFSLSAGYFLAASLLRGFDREVYNIRIKWLHPFPHFYCNTEDARMAGRNCEINVALMLMAPMFCMAGLVSVWHPEANYIFLLGIFFMTAPTPRSPCTLLLRGLYRRIPLSTEQDYAFVENRLFLSLLNRKIKFSDKKFLLANSLYVIGWFASIMVVNIKIFNLNAESLLSQFMDKGMAKPISLILFIGIGGLVLISVAYLLWILFKNIYFALQSLFKPGRKKIKVHEKLELTTNDIVDFFKECLLLKELNDKTLFAIANRVNGEIIDRKKFVFHEGDPGEEVFFIYGGRVEVIHELKTGRLLKITDLGRGDVFGEIALLKNVPRTRSIRAAEKTLLLTLSRRDFKKLIVQELGIDKIENVIEKQAFLMRIPLCAEWHPQALVKFAHIAKFSSFGAGDVIIKQGMVNQFFYLIYDGLLEVSIGKKKVATLKSGDFFGEISLLQNSSSTANVTAKIDSRCMVVSRKDFLAFLGTDFLIGLQFEEISSKRLKHPIFPLTGIAYEGDR